LKGGDHWKTYAWIGALAVSKIKSLKMWTGFIWLKVGPVAGF
jgi:hypothetical protein